MTETIKSTEKQSKHEETSSDIPHRPFLEKIVCLPISIAGGFLGGVAGNYLVYGLAHFIIDSPEKIYAVYTLTTVGALIGSVHSYLSAREIFFKKSWYE